MDRPLIALVQKQGNKTLNTPETQKTNRKTDPNETNYTLVWYAFYDLRLGNGVGPIITTMEYAQGGYLQHSRANSQLGNYLQDNPVYNISQYKTLVRPKSIHLAAGHKADDCEISCKYHNFCKV